MVDAPPGDPTMSSAARFEVSRRNLREAHWVDVPAAPLADGQVRVRVERFALTSNNITYAAFGEAMRYWDFYPTGNAETGCIPVWGFATVAESRCDGVAVGERLYGYWPIADTAVLTPARVGPAGFVDGAAHRRELHPVYNHVRFTRADPSWQADREAEQALLEPLFTTSFLIDDFLADNGFFGAAQVVLSSASSKTAYGTAFCLAQRPRLAVVGLTSAGNKAFTASLGCYGRVVGYDEIATALDAAVPTVYVDMSGSAEVRRAVHGHFGERLAYSCAVGGTHWDALTAGGAKLPGPKPTLFFAPAQIKKRHADWGAAGLAQRVAAAWGAFLGRAGDPAAPWLRVVDGRGHAAIAATYATLVDGRIDPRDGHMLSPAADVA
jgi:Protein of unknown function (DUF2855)